MAGSRKRVVKQGSAAGRRTTGIVFGTVVWGVMLVCLAPTGLRAQVNPAGTDTVQPPVGLQRWYPQLRQPTPRMAQDPYQFVPPAPRLSITYGGAAYFSFPNYDIRLFPGAFGEIQEDLTGVAPAIPTVIYKSNGYYWDGDDFFLSPAYPHELVSRYHYDRDVIGAPRGTQWPNLPTPTVGDRRPAPTGPPAVSEEIEDFRYDRRVPREHVQRYLGMPLPAPSPPEEEPTTPDEPEDRYPPSANEGETNGSRTDRTTPAVNSKIRPRRNRVTPLHIVGPQPPREEDDRAVRRRSSTRKLPRRD